MSTKVLCILLLTLGVGMATAQDENWYTAKAKEGDGILTMMKRYHLTESACDLAKFYEINDLKPSSYLIADKTYKLPIYIYPYNGQSIRSTIGIDEWDRAVSIQKYNETILAKGLRKTHFRDSKLLWVPYSGIHCYEVATGSEGSEFTDYNGDYLNVPLFGDKYEKVEIHDQKLKGHVYYVVSGHGGPDPGAMCTDCPETLCEDEYAYDVSLRLVRNLMQHGAIVHMVIQDKNDGIRDARYLKCDKDEVLTGGEKIPLNNKKRLYQRAGAINHLYRKYKSNGIKHQRAIVIHVDSRSKSHQQDVFFYYHEKSKTGQSMAKTMQDVFKRKYDKYQKGRGYKGTVKHRNLHMLRATSTPTVFVELANIRNKNDHRRLLPYSNRQALANWLFEGLTGVEM